MSRIITPTDKVGRHNGSASLSLSESGSFHREAELSNSASPYPQFIASAESELSSWLFALDYNRFVYGPRQSLGLPIVERFGWHGRAIEPGFRRIRVMARQTYVFCHAALGGNTTARQHAMTAAAALIERGVGANGQFYCRLSPDGSVLNPDPDLYDIAFGLFAMAWWYRLTGEDRALDIAERSINNLRASMASTSGRGYLASLRYPQSHEQNPHMHLFEAAIFLAAFSKRPEFRALADELFELAEAALFDATTGTLPEVFDHEWRPVGQDGLYRVEPGHHYEWVWLLHRYGDLASQPKAFAIARTLFAFAQQHGHDEATGLVLDAVDQHGHPTATDLRIWPNAEFLKAQVVMQERYGAGEGFSETAILNNVQRIRRYFLTPQPDGPASALPKGLWIDYLEGTSYRPKCDHVPASSLYHIFFAFAELLRHRAGHSPFSGLPW